LYEIKHLLLNDLTWQYLINSFIVLFDVLLQKVDK